MSATKPLTSNIFRQDINGLRAVAVLAVLLYHFEIPYFSGGFVGVDVFFVISGYLMTQVISQATEEKRFSFIEFYAARVRRILPALLTLCICLLILGYYRLAPSEYIILAKHTIGSSGFFSNFIYYDESGYFDDPSRYKWLLHTWSLSVEWQFYLLFPLLIYPFLHAYRRVFSVFCILISLSFAASVYYTPVKDVFAFFLLPTRIWEMMIGGMVYLTLPETGNPWSEKAGLSLIILSVLSFDSDSLWPGHAALVPVSGAALILYARSERILARPVWQGIGTVSYSLYLWHWPVVVGLAYFGVEGMAWKLTGIAAALGLGVLSYLLVEMPARKHFRTPRAASGVAALGIGCVLLIGGTVVATDGLRGRVSPAVLAADDGAKDHVQVNRAHCGFDRETRHLPRCVIGAASDARPRIMLVGDSHAESLVPAALEAAGEEGIEFYHFSCVTLFDTELKVKSLREDYCPEFNRAMLDKVRALPKDGRVVVVNRYSVNVRGPNEGEQKVWGIRYLDMSEAEKAMTPDALYAKRLADSLCAIHAIRPVSAVLPIPEMGVDVPKVLARRLMAHGASPDISLPMAVYEERNAVALQALRTAQEQCGVTLLDPRPILCGDGRCKGSEQGRPLYFDDDHLNGYGSRKLSPLFRY